MFLRYPAQGGKEAVTENGADHDGFGHVLDGRPAGDGSQIGKSLQTLGEHTTKAAASATPDAQAKLQQLGQTLSSAATSLKG